VNRLLVPYLLHGIATLESGIASAEAIDTAMKLGCGHPMGPLALSDLIGLDVVRAMAETLSRELKDSRYDMPKTLLQLTDAGQLGRKTGSGIFDYSGEQPKLNPAIKLG
jgi:3-hydroxybutyryl-CoA dehydrogenase